MPYRTTPLVTREFYHVYNRGLAKQNIFTQNRDYTRFVKSLFYYQIQNPKPKFSLYQISKNHPIDENKKIVDIICYCLMPNHFHLLLRQNIDGGISELMRRFTHSYAKYLNVKYNHFGPIFQGMFKVAHIETDEQLLHLSRYIHLNPLTANLITNLKLYPWSSYNTYLGQTDNPNISKNLVLDLFKSGVGYEQFVLDQADYGRTLELLKHTHIDAEE